MDKFWQAGKHDKARQAAADAKKRKIIYALAFIMAWIVFGLFFSGTVLSCWPVPLQTE